MAATRRSEVTSAGKGMLRVLRLSASVAIQPLARLVAARPSGNDSRNRTAANKRLEVAW